MKFNVLTSNESVPNGEDESVALFNRAAWFSRFEQFVCTNSSSIKTFSFTSPDKNFYLPLIAKDQQLKGLTNYYTPFYKMIGNTVLSPLEHKNAILLCQEELQAYGVIDLVPLYKTDADIWKKAFDSIGLKSFLYRHSINWYHDNITDVDQFWSLRPSKLRNTVKRKKAKIDKTGEYSTIMCSAKNITDLNLILAHYHHVYYDSWKQVEPYPAFIDAIVKYTWQQGELRLGLVYHKEKPVAGQIWFVNGPTAYIFKLAYRREYTKTSVGTILTAFMMEHVIEQDKVRCIDFLTGDDGYKKDWMQSKRELMGIQACNLSSFTGQRSYLRNMFSNFRKSLTT